jgi:hypothetical protein
MLVSWLERRAGRLALAIAAGALLLRLAGLEAFWLNPDEGVHVSIAAQPTWSGFAADLLEHTNPPAFYVPMRPVALWTSEPVALRLPACLFGTLAVYALFLLGRRAFGAATGLASALLLAAAPGAVASSQLVRPYSLQLAAVALALWALWRYLAAQRRSDLALHAAFLALAVLTHYGSALVLAALVVWLAGLALAGGLPRAAWRALAGVHAAIAGLLAGLYGLHFRAHLVGSAPEPGLQEWLHAYLRQGAGELWTSFVGTSQYLFGARHAGLATLVLCVGLAASLRGGGRRFAGLALCALGVAALLSVNGRYPFGDTRHVSYLFALTTPLVAEGARTLCSGRGLRPLLGAAGLVALWVEPGIADRIALTSPPPGGGQLAVERLARRADVLALERPLADLRERGALLVMDRQTHAFLFPFLRDARLREAEGAERPYRVYAWGGSELVVARAWQLHGGPRGVAASDHVAGFLRRLPQAREARELWLAAAGWPPLPFAGLRRLGVVASEERGARVPSVFGRSAAGLVRLDAARLLEADPAAEPARAERAE